MGSVITEEPQITQISASAHSGHPSWGRDGEQQARGPTSKKSGGSESHTRLFSSQHAGFLRLIEVVQESTNVIGGVVKKSDTLANIALPLAQSGMLPPVAYPLHVMTI
jgi:hypothetical protein